MSDLVFLFIKVIFSTHVVQNPAPFSGRRSIVLSIEIWQNNALTVSALFIRQSEIEGDLADHIAVARCISALSLIQRMFVERQDNWLCDAILSTQKESGVDAPSAPPPMFHPDDGPSKVLAAQSLQYPFRIFLKTKNRFRNTPLSCGFRIYQMRERLHGQECRRKEPQQGQSIGIVASVADSVSRKGLVGVIDTQQADTERDESGEERGDVNIFSSDERMQRVEDDQMSFALGICTYGRPDLSFEPRRSLVMCANEPIHATGRLESLKGDEDYGCSGDLPPDARQQLSFVMSMDSGTH